jgi:hypothetical protein
VTARVFISYRSSDGTDKATALARDLDALFGQDQVFLDKEDLPGGTPWRDEIARALGSGPVLLALVTPNYLGARDAEGRRHIENAEDPVRTELEAAIAANAHVIPLLCDGVTQTPRRDELSPPFDQLAERTWRRLRAYDWRQDVGRLAEDLRRLGVVPREGATPVNTVPSRPVGLLDGHADAGETRSRRPLLLAGATLLVVGAGGYAAWRWQKERRASLTGRWRANIGGRGASNARDGEVVMINVENDGKKLHFTSSAIDVEHAREWRNHRDYWKQRYGKDLKQVLYRGEGELLDESDDRLLAGVPVGPRRILVVVRIEVPEGGEPIDTGSLRASVDADDRRLRGRLFLNGERGDERVVDLRREP